MLFVLNEVLEIKTNLSKHSDNSSNARIMKLFQGEHNEVSHKGPALPSQQLWGDNFIIDENIRQPKYKKPLL